MSDALVRGFLPSANLKASLVVVSRAAREGQKLHGLHDVSARLLGEAMAAGALLVSLQKDQSRVNLQLECDGPLRGLFVDAGADGALRGYVKNPYLAVEGNKGPMRWRPALGNSGFLSVLKDLGEREFYRSSVELKALDLAADLGGYFESSEQVATRVALGVERRGDEPLGAVAGVVVQALPDGNREALEALGGTLQARLDAALEGGPELEAEKLFGELLPAFEVNARVPLQWRCTCSKQRVLNALGAMGKTELGELLTKDGQAAASCQFCGKRHVATREDLQALIAALPA